jgi:hypothetical protein
MKDHTPDQLREKLSWWRSQYAAATVRTPLDKAMRERVERVCETKIREYEALVAELPAEGPEAA